MKLIQMWQWINATSLDIVAGSLSSMLFSVAVLGVELPLAIWFALPISVWIFYTADHLLDALGTVGVPLSSRHLLHRKSSRLLLFSLAVVLVALLYLVFYFLPLNVLIGGFVLAGLVLFYLAIVFWGRRKGKQIPKELLIALIYTAGTWGPAIIVKRFALNKEEFLLLAIFAILVALEGMIAAYYDFELDTKEDHPSFIRFLGKKRGKTVINYIGLATQILIIAYFFLAGNNFSLFSASVYWLMSICLIVILNLPSFFATKERFRLFGEILFVLPGAYILCCGNL